MNTVIVRRKGILINDTCTVYSSLHNLYFSSYILYYLYYTMFCVNYCVIFIAFACVAWAVEPNVLST